MTIDNPEKLATLGTQDEEKQTHKYTQTSTHNVKQDWTFLQTAEGKDEPNKGFCGKRNGHKTRNSEHKDIIGQQNKKKIQNPKRWATWAPPSNLGYNKYALNCCAFVNISILALLQTIEI